MLITAGFYARYLLSRGAAVLEINDTPSASDDSGEGMFAPCEARRTADLPESFAGSMKVLLNNARKAVVPSGKDQVQVWGDPLPTSA